MPRAPYQILVIPFRKTEDGLSVCIFHRSDMDIWQFIAGGGEDEETPAETAVREAYEEAGISDRADWYALDTCCSISASIFPEKYRKYWSGDVFVVPEHVFAVSLDDAEVYLSHEHTTYEWVDCKTACTRLRYDSNIVALTELQERLEKNKMRRLK